MAVSTTTAVKVRKTHLVVAGTSYFRGRAPELQLLSWGKKRTPVTKANYLDPAGRLNPARFDVRVATKLTIDVDQGGADELMADVTVPQLEHAGASVSAARELASEGRLKLVMLQVSRKQLADVINGTPKTLETFKQTDDDVRIVDVGLFVARAELADRIDVSVEGSVEATVDGISVGLGAGHEEHSQTRVTFRRGTLFAYGLAKPRWDAERKKQRTRIESFSSDQQGMG
jgi:hypothetical protein